MQYASSHFNTFKETSQVVNKKSDTEDFLYCLDLVNLRFGFLKFSENQMCDFNIMTAMCSNRGIGFENKLPWPYLE
jgi:hypothetical protein